MIEIYILTGDIQSGKSAQLIEFVKNKSVAGFLTPTKEGVKVMLNIESQQVFPYQLLEPTINSISVGKYHLDGVAFQLACEIYNQANPSKHEWFVMDEIGKLELNGEGHAELLHNVLNTWNAKLLLVIRNSLLNEILKSFEIEEYKLLSQFVETSH